MSEQDKQDEAKQHAGRAGRQIKHAARNVGRAARDEVEHVDEVVEGTIAEGIETGQRKIGRLSPHGLSSLASDTGIGFFALSVALYAGAISFNKFRAVYRGRGRAVIR